ncbi:DUF2243 domain-containing protein [Actinocorallia sp. B10E7]|uniref:DUF2243 domain-containing protein n=1 Tax=Actinocorallia sp. B10E7 TaxID=3153558 RepID=UPI00325E4E7B
MSVRSDRSLWAGVLLGVGASAFADEAVFHRLLRWHRFYDESASGIGLVSDGLFHAFGWFATVFGLAAVADAARRGVLRGRVLGGGVLLGGGAFQLYDGIVHHKLLRLHQSRYGVDISPYDWTWNAVAALMLVAGCWLLLPALRRPGGAS